MESDVPGGDEFGRVGYTHAAGIDAPLSVIRTGHVSGNVTLIPHSDYRGAYHAASTSNGGMYNCGPSDACLYVVWPKPFWGSYFKGGDPAAGDWAGSLIRGQQDISGLMYRRNRYYDPMTGQFTQSDPIGIAGGLNAYGFANGDPVSYADPYGLKADSIIYDSPKTQRIIKEAAAKSPRLARAIQLMDEDPKLIVNVVQVAPGSLGAENPGAVTPVGFTTQGQYMFEVKFDFKQVEVMNRVPKYAENGGVTIGDVVGHEFYGHLFPWTGKAHNGIPYMCPDVNNCARNRENVIRKEMGHPPRTW
jgi:RHS repeat-associated protein